jgi:hypothetical protein
MEVATEDRSTGVDLAVVMAVAGFMLRLPPLWSKQLLLFFKTCKARFSLRGE